MEKLTANHSIHKNTIPGVDDASKNKTAVRAFRDITTDVYVEIFLSDPDQLTNFLDYTFHLLSYKSSIQINKSINDYNRKHPNAEILPLCGPERAYLIFKGGTLMNKFYSMHLSELFKGKNFSLEEINDTYKVDLVNFGVDLESDTNGNDNNNSNNNKNSTYNDFLSTLKKKFSVSDTDYSLQLYATEPDRFDIIYKFAVSTLSQGFDAMNFIFDNYLNDVSNPNHSVNFPDSIYDHTDDTNDTNYSSKISDILNILRDHIYDTKFNIIGNDNNNAKKKIIDTIIPSSVAQSVNINIDSKQSYKTYILDFINNMNYDTSTKIYELYDLISIIDLMIFMDIPLTNIRKKVNLRILRLINKKLVNLKNGMFYTFDKIKAFKQLMFEKFNRIYNDPNLKSYREIKYELNYHPIKKSKYDKLQWKNAVISTDQFGIDPRNSIYLASSSNPFIYDITKKSDYKTVHYSTFNACIRKVRSTFSVVDFDLMRTKFNVVVSNVISKNDKDNSSVLIPAEFIDVSIPRYEDTGRKTYFNGLVNNNFTPNLLNIKKSNGKSICVYSYSIEDVSHDLQYVLTLQASQEPWLDIKYAKRIIRLIVFIVINSYIQAKKMHNDVQNTNMNESLDLLDFCHTTYKYITEQQAIYPSKSVATFIDVTQNTDKSDVMNYINMIQQNISLWLNVNIPSTYLTLKHQYNDFDLLLKNLILWSWLYKLHDNELLKIIQTMFDLYSQKNQYNLHNVSVVRNNFRKLIRILYDYGYKLHYAYFIELNK